MKNFKVEANELLQRNDLKSVFGGNAEDELKCTDKCSSDSDCPDGMMGMQGVCKTKHCLGHANWHYCTVE